MDTVKLFFKTVPTGWCVRLPHAQTRGLWSVVRKKSVNGREWRASRAAQRCALCVRARVSWAVPQAESWAAGLCMCVLHPPPRFVVSQTSEAWV